MVSQSQDRYARIQARINMGFLQRRSGTGASLHAGRPSNDDLINRAKHAYLLQHYRQTRQIELTNLEPHQIELYLQGKILYRPTMHFAYKLNLKLRDLTQLSMEAKVPYRYDQSIEQRRWLRIVKERRLSNLPVKEHDRLIQEPARSKDSLAQRTWDGIVNDEFRRNLSAKQHDHLVQGTFPNTRSDNTEQKRWDEILKQEVVRRMTVKEHDAIIQRPARSEKSIEQRRWDRTVYEEWLRNLTVKEHDRFAQGLLKVPAHITRPGVQFIEPKVTNIYAEDA